MLSMRLVWEFVAALVFSGVLALLVYMVLLRAGLSPDRAASIAVPTWPAFVVALFTVALWHATRDQVKITEALAHLEKSLACNRLKPYVLLEKALFEVSLPIDGLASFNALTKAAGRLWLLRFVNLREAPAYVDWIRWRCCNREVGPVATDLFVPPAAAVVPERDVISIPGREKTGIRLELGTTLENLFNDKKLASRVARELGKFAQNTAEQGIPIRQVEIPKRVDLGELEFGIRRADGGSRRIALRVSVGDWLYFFASKDHVLARGRVRFEEVKKEHEDPCVAFGP